MGSKLKNLGLIGLGVIAGIAGSMQFEAAAQKASNPLPLEELRQLADVFGLIKSDYVEHVEDKKLLTEAISGMVASLDPHSAYLDKKAFKELREGTQASSSAWASKSAWKTVTSRLSRRSRTPPRSRPV